MSKYKVGDIVKLSTGEKGIVKDVKYKCEIENDDTYNLYEKEIIGLWEERNSVNSSVKKYDSPDVGEMAEHFREDTKMIEPTDNTKIEELEAMGETKFEYGEPVPADWVMANKINEIIRYINK